MPQSQGTFTAVNNVESQVFGFDFSQDLPTGDSVTTVNDIELTVAHGTDANPSSHLSGAPGVTANTATQRIAGLLPNVVYKLMIVVNTAQGNVIDLWNYIACVP